MLVTADASPLHYLILIASTDILPALFGRIVIPRAVAEELQHPRTPIPVRALMAAVPAWLDIRGVDTAPDATLARLDPGEQDAIALGQDLHPDQIAPADFAETRSEKIRQRQSHSHRSPLSR